MPFEDINNKENAFVQDDSIYNKQTKAVPKPESNIGVDTDNTVLNKIADNVSEECINGYGSLDLAALENFTHAAQNREQIYALLDSMSEDPTIAAALELYAEDATEYNDQGRIVWAEAADANISAYITFLIDTMNVDKHIYSWVYNLCKYGDVYLRLYRQSDYDTDVLKDKLDAVDDQNLNLQTNPIISKQLNENKRLDEDVRVIAYSRNDKYAHYVEMIPNPAEMFELTKYNKTYAYIKAPIMEVNYTQRDNQSVQPYADTQFMKYQFNRNDVDIHGPTDYVHATLSNNASRTPEEVTIFIEDPEEANKITASTTYRVNRGQSILYNVFKIWRELSLLENSILLNRLTKSSIIRLINVEVGDMPKEMVGPHLSRIKSLMEQKAAINTNKTMNEYTNPGPVENLLYIPTHGGVGAITTDQVGGDVNVGQLSDLDYFKNKYYGALKIPKQFMGDTEDGAGFNGGQSLSIISSRYAKMIKRIQNAMIQALTDCINLMLLDKGLSSYVNKFTLHMQPPTTQEEIDRRDNLASKIQVTGDIMNTLQDIEDPIIRLKILKALLSNVVTDPEVTKLIQEQIDALESDKEAGEDATDDTDEDFADFSSDSDLGTDSSLDLGSDIGLEDNDFDTDTIVADDEAEAAAASGSEETLPTPDDLGIDMTDNTQQI